MSTSTSMHEEMNGLRSSMHVAELLGGRVVGGVGGPKHVSGGGLMLAEQAGVQVPAQRPWPRGSEGGGVGPGGGGRERQEAAPPRGIQEGASTVGVAEEARQGERKMRMRTMPLRLLRSHPRGDTSASVPLPPGRRNPPPLHVVHAHALRLLRPTPAARLLADPAPNFFASTSDVRPRPLVGGWRGWC